MIYLQLMVLPQRYAIAYALSSFILRHTGLLTGWRMAALPWLKQTALALLGWTNPHGPASPVKQQGYILDI